MTTSEYKGSADIQNETRRLELMAEIANKEARRALKPLVQADFNPSTIVDFGCGTGDACSVLHSLFPHAEIIGIDASPKALAVASGRHPEMTLLERDIAAPDVCTGLQINLAYFRNVLLHVRDPKAVLKNIVANTSSGGYIVAQEPDWAAADANWEDFHIFKKAFIAMMLANGINPFMGQSLRTFFTELNLQGIQVDVSSVTIWGDNASWEILYFLLEVGGQRIVPFLKERGVTGVEEMKERMESAQKGEGTYFKTPNWVITYGRV